MTVSDSTILLRDMAGDAAQSAATRINPSEERLAQIDRPAEDNTWHEVPSVSDIKGRANDLVQKNKPLSKGDVQDAANSTANADDPQAAGQGQAAALKDKASANVPDETKDNLNQAQDKLKETKDTARLKAKSYLSKKVPQDRRDQTVWRLKKMIVEIQGHEDCRFHPGTGHYNTNHARRCPGYRDSPVPC